MLKKLLPTLLLSYALFSQSLFDKISNDARTFWKDAGSFFTAPLKFEREDISRLAYVSLITAGLFAVDGYVYDFQKVNFGSFKFMMRTDRIYGTVWLWGAVSGVMYSYGLFFNSDELREMGLMIFEAGAFAGLIASGFKFALGRARPYANEGKLTFRPFRLDDKYFSLPSGHATLSFAMSGVIASKFESSLAKIIIYTPAVLTALSRVHNNMHWFSDVFLGSAIGYFSATYIVKLHKERKVY